MWVLGPPVGGIVREGLGVILLKEVWGRVGGEGWLWGFKSPHHFQRSPSLCLLLVGQIKLTAVAPTLFLPAYCPALCVKLTDSPSETVSPNKLFPL